ncbi:uncharacterized protein [Misgurnus anguillicaudatus]|uniref:uncharacterized protein n=1 Tax=Misgurnus anguillicaudatus TaxID=75329 RepID=UPI003CCF57F4
MGLCFYRWVNSLRAAQMKETTVKHYVDNFAQFIDFIAEAPPQSCRLSRNVLTGVRREMKGIRKSLKRGVALHQTKVKAEKEEKVILKSTLVACKEKAASHIPDALDLLDSDPSSKNQWRFYRLFSAYLACLFGHWGGVLQNMTIAEVMGAKYSHSEKAYLINITSHKTNHVYGPAQIVLNKDEYTWALRFLEVKDKLPGGPQPSSFFSHPRRTPARA